MNCPQCGVTSPFASGSFCRNCGTFIAPSAHTIIAAPNDSDIPWESSHNAEAPLTALLLTLSACMFHPVRFFSEIAASKKESLRPALWYGLITGSFGVLASWMWGELYVKFGQSFTDYTTLFGNSFASPSMLIATPILMLIQFALIGSYTWFVMRFCKSTKASISEIFRVLCYAESASVLLLIPIVGSFASIILWIYMILEGFHHLFLVSKLKVFIMLLLPLLLLSVLVAIIAGAALMGGIMAGTGVLQQWESLLK